MAEINFDIHHRIVHIEQQLLEEERTQKLRKEVAQQIEKLEHEIQSVQAHQTMLAQRIIAHDTITPKDPEWLHRKNVLDADRKQTVLHINWLKPQLAYHFARRTELENRGLTSGQIEALRQEQNLLRERQRQILQHSELPEVWELEEVTTSIGEIKVHIVELDEALTICLKVKEALGEIIQEARNARRALIISAEQSPHRATYNKLSQTQVQLAWLQRELWDTGLEFDSVPDLHALLDHYQPTLFEAATLPRRIGTVSTIVEEKEGQLYRELASSRRLLARLEAKQYKLIDRLWRPSVLRQLQDADTLRQRVRAAADDAPQSTQHARLVVVESEPESEPILRIGLQDLA